MAVIDVRFQDLQEKTLKEKTYPWIGKIYDNSLIVLFTSKKHGTVLEPGYTSWNVGDYLDCWDENRFEPYTKEIILQMKE
jgi:hypothetical protein